MTVVGGIVQARSSIRGVKGQDVCSSLKKFLHARNFPTHCSHHERSLFVPIENIGIIPSLQKHGKHLVMPPSCGDVKCREAAVGSSSPEDTRIHPEDRFHHPELTVLYSCEEIEFDAGVAAAHALAHIRRAARIHNRTKSS